MRFGGLDATVTASSMKVGRRARDIRALFLQDWPHA